MKNYFGIALLAAVGASSVQAARISLDEITTRGLPTVEQYITPGRVSAAQEFLQSRKKLINVNQMKAARQALKKIPKKYINEISDLKQRIIDQSPKVAAAVKRKNPKTINMLQKKINKYRAELNTVYGKIRAMGINPEALGL